MSCPLNLPVFKVEQKTLQRGPWPVGCHLTHFVENWRHLGASPYCLKILLNGYLLPFNLYPTLTNTPVIVNMYADPKGSGGWRPVIDLIVLNQHLDIPSFKMETPESIRNELNKGE